MFIESLKVAESSHDSGYGVEWAVRCVSNISTQVSMI